jgi:hypothetical protein
MPEPTFQVRPRTGGITHADAPLLPVSASRARRFFLDHRRLRGKLSTTHDRFSLPRATAQAKTESLRVEAEHRPRG